MNGKDRHMVFDCTRKEAGKNDLLLKYEDSLNSLRAIMTSIMKIK